MTEDPSLLSEADSGVGGCVGGRWGVLVQLGRVGLHFHSECGPCVLMRRQLRDGPRSSSVPVPRGAQAPSLAGQLSWHFRMRESKSRSAFKAWLHGMHLQWHPQQQSRNTTAASSGSLVESSARCVRLGRVSCPPGSRRLLGCSFSA